MDISTDDPAWVTNQVDPDSFQTTVGGAATAGAYTLTLTPEDGSAAIVNTFTRVAEDNTGIATGLNADIVAKIPGTLDPYLRGSSSALAILQTLVRIDDTPFLRRFQVSTTAPGAGTLVAGPDDIFPITERFSFFQTPPGEVEKIWLSFVAVDASDEPVANNADLRFDVKLVERIDRGAALDLSVANGVTSTTSVTGLSVENEIEVPINGTQGVGIHIANITGPPTPDFDAIEVWWRPGST